MLLVGGFNPSENYEFASSDNEIPMQYMESHKIPWFQTTNQIYVQYILPWFHDQIRVITPMLSSNPSFLNEFPHNSLPPQGVRCWVNRHPDKGTTWTTYGKRRVDNGVWQNRSIYPQVPYFGSPCNWICMCIYILYISVVHVYNFTVLDSISDHMCPLKSKRFISKPHTIRALGHLTSRMRT